MSLPASPAFRATIVSVSLAGRYSLFARCDKRLPQRVRSGGDDEMSLLPGAGHDDVEQPGVVREGFDFSAVPLVGAQQQDRGVGFTSLGLVQIIT